MPSKPCSVATSTNSSTVSVSGFCLPVSTLASLTGGTAAPKPTVALRPIPMCKGMLGQFLREKPAGSKSPRRFYRIDATGTIQRSETKVTQVHIRGVWDAQSSKSNPLCTNHQVCFTGTWVYFRID